MEKPFVEICAGSIASVNAAARGGAARVELCSGLTEGGLTPSAGFIREARKVAGVRLHVLIRPRGGDFVYSPEDVKIMCDDIAIAREAGADGVVIGALNPDGTIDIPTTRRLIEAAGEMHLTFHRAFDLCRDPEIALGQLIDLGCSTILTSGQAPTALEGASLIRKLNDIASGRISLMPGCGVNSRNAAEIARLTGCHVIHASARRPIGSSMTFRNTAVAMGTPGSDEYSLMETSEDEVAAIVKSFCK